MTHHALGIIPARWGSSRFPGKPLHPIAGKPLIQWTYENAKSCAELEKLIVATDDPRIFDTVQGFGGEVVMTSSDCPTGSDRLVEVLEQRSDLDEYDIIVNVQGDEPCLPVSTISRIIHDLAHDPEAQMATAAIPFHSKESFADPSRVKAAIDQCGNALFFSRVCPVQHQVDFESGPIYHHLGIYAFRRRFLLEYGALKPTPLQLGEQLEQMKVLERGYRIKVAVVQEPALGVDTPEDAIEIEKWLWKQNISSSQAESARH